MVSAVPCNLTEKVHLVNYTRGREVILQFGSQTLQWKIEHRCAVWEPNCMNPRPFQLGEEASSLVVHITHSPGVGD